MKKVIGITFMAVWLSTHVVAQEIKLYNPDANAKEEIDMAIKKAAKENKHVFLQIGGNWCSWCVKFHRFVEGDNEINSFVNQNFVVVKVNYDPKNKNEEVLADLEYPQRFGFPVFVILDKNGNRIHTQNSAYLEKDSGYDKERVLQFFKHWAPAALHPDSYKK